MDQVQQRPISPTGDGGGGLLRRNLWAMLAAAAATVVVQLGVYAIARGAMTPAVSTRVSVLFGLFWVVLAVPIFAAGGARALDGLFRGGPVLDASAVLLIVLAAAGQITALEAVKIYLLWCGLGLAQIAMVSTAKQARGQQIVAAVAILIVLALAASPFWANGMILAGSQPWRERFSYALMAMNPVFATIRCLPGGVGFVWNEGPILYECTSLSRDVPVPEAPWYVTAAAYGVIAAALAGVTALRRRR